MAQREATISFAIADYRAGRFSSINKCADAYGIPKSTLKGRLKGAQSKTVSNQHQQRLSAEQESFLSEWVLEEDARGFSPSHARLREMASKILKLNGDQIPLGQLWVTNYLRRHPELASRVGRKPEAQRTEAETPEEINAFLGRIGAARTKYAIRV